MEEWIPEPLGQPLDEKEQADLNSVAIIAGPNGPKPKLVSTGKTAINLASYNFTGLAGNEHIKERAVETLRKYGLGSCGPPGFYGSLGMYYLTSSHPRRSEVCIDVHMDLEKDLADFLGTESAILYSQGFSTISSVIPAFCKRGDIIVADRGVNFVIQKGIQISRSTVRWFDHNDLKSLEEVLESVEKERRKRRAPLTRRFIITEGIFQKDGAMVDLPKLVSDTVFTRRYDPHKHISDRAQVQTQIPPDPRRDLVLRYCWPNRTRVDGAVQCSGMPNAMQCSETFSSCPSQAEKVDMLVGSVAVGLCSAGGFCAGSRNVVEHQVCMHYIFPNLCSPFSLAHQRDFIRLLCIHARPPRRQRVRGNQHPPLDPLHSHRASR